MKTVRRPPYPKWNPGYFPCTSLIPLPLSSRRPSVSFGGFGLKLKAKYTKAYEDTAQARVDSRAAETARAAARAEAARIEAARIEAARIEAARLSPNPPKEGVGLAS